MPVEMVDERLTSWEAERILEEELGRRIRPEADREGRPKAVSPGEGKYSVDAVAAMVILREYLSRERVRGVGVACDFWRNLVSIVLLAGGAGAGYFWYCIEKPYGAVSAEGDFVDIPHGASQRAIARLLEKSGVIRNAFAFEIYARRHPKRTLEAGEYLFDHPITGKEVFWKLANGEVYQQPFTVKEGETIFDIPQIWKRAKVHLRRRVP